jgi:hypothetical protein
VIGLLRFVGILNAAVWCGSAIFLTIGLPALFSPELKKLLTPAGVGFAAEAVFERFYILQYCCGVIAILHLAAEWFYCGRPVRRLNLALLVGLLAVALAGGEVAQPRMRALHEIKYFGKTAQQQQDAAKEFAFWHATSQIVNLFVMTGLVFYLWSVSAPPESTRFGGFSKIRG